MSFKRQKLSHVAQFLAGGSRIIVETKVDEETIKRGKCSSNPANDLEAGVREDAHQQQGGVEGQYGSVRL